MARKNYNREREIFIVGVGRFVIEMSGNDDLKAKRSIVSKIRDKILDRYNVSFAEVGPQDTMDEAILGIAAVASDRSYLERLFNQIPDYIDGMGVCRVMSEDIDIQNY